MRNGHEKSEAMRARLASVGIFLDDEKPEPEPTAPQAEAVVDREVVRQVLIERGAPERDLEWLTASAPSVDAARNYNPPEK